MNYAPHPATMPTWQDIEDVMALWQREANGPAWRDLHDARGTMDYLKHPLPHQCGAYCGTCNDRTDLALFLEERAAATAVDLRPELRLRAASVSARQSQG